LLRIELRHQLGRALEVGEQRGDRLPLTVDAASSIGLLRCDANLGRDGCVSDYLSGGGLRTIAERGAAIRAELGVGWSFGAAFGTANRKRAAAFGAESFAWQTLGSAFRAAHISP